MPTKAVKLAIITSGADKALSAMTNLAEKKDRLAGDASIKLNLLDSDLTTDKLDDLSAKIKEMTDKGATVRVNLMGTDETADGLQALSEDANKLSDAGARVSASFKDIGDSATDVASCLSRYEAASDSASGAIDKLAESSTAATEAATKYAAAQDDAASASARLAALADGDKASAAELADAQNAAAEASARMADAGKDAADTQAAYATSLDAASAAADRSLDAQIRLGDAELATGDKAADSEAKQGEAASSMSSKLAMASLVIVGLGYESIKMAGSFQESATQLVTGAGESEKNLGMVKNGMLAISAQTDTSASQISSAMFMVESAGFHGAAGLDVMKAAAEGAKVGNADVADVANAVTSALNAYGLKGKDAATITNELTATVAAGKLHMDDLARSIGNVLPVAASAHIAYSQIGGAIATMTAQGMTARRASMNLRTTIVSLLSPTATQAAAMDKFGVNSYNLSKNLGKVGLTGTINELSQAILNNTKGGTVMASGFSAMSSTTKGYAQQILAGSLSTAQLTAATKTLSPQQASLLTAFSKSASSASGLKETYAGAMKSMMGTTTGLQVALLLGGQHAATFAKNVKSVQDAADKGGQSVHGFAEIQGDFNFRVGQAKTSLQDMAISFGSALLPAVTAVIKPVAGLAADLLKYPTLTKVIAGLAIAFVAVVAAAKGFSFIQGVQKNLSNMGSAISGVVSKLGLQTAATEGATGATTELDGAMDANPIGIIVIAIAALVLGFIELYKHCKIVRDAVADLGKICDGAMKIVKRAFDDVFGWVKKNWPLLAGILLGPIGIAVGLIITHFKLFKETLLGVWRDIWNSIGKPVVKAFDDVKSAITGGFDSFWKSHGAEIKEIWSGLWTAIKVVFHAVWDPLAAAIKASIDVISTVFKVAKDIITPIWRIMWIGISTEVRIAFTVIHTVISMALIAIETIVKVGLDVLKGIFKVGFDIVKGVLTAAFDAMRMVVKVALDVIKGVIGIGLDLITGHWSKAWHDLLTMVKAIWSDIKQGISSLISDIVHTFSSIGKDMYNVGKAIIDGLIKGIKDFADKPVQAIKKVGSDIVKGVKDVLHIFSPSGVMADQGKFIVQGLHDGIASSKQAEIAMRAMGTSVVSSFRAELGIAGKTSAVFQQHGTAMIQSLAQSITAGSTMVNAAITKMCANIQQVMQECWQKIRQDAQSGWQSIQEQFVTVLADIMAEFRTVLTTLRAFMQQTWTACDTDIEQVFKSIQAYFTTFWAQTKDLFQTTATNILSEVHAAWQTLQTDTTQQFNSIYTTFQQFWQKTQQGFTQTVSAVRAEWLQLESASRTPVNYVISSVFDNGLLKLWNDVASMAGVGKVSSVGTVSAAGGAVIPGYAPGIDSVPAMVSPGESILVPELTRHIGASNIMAANNAFSGGRTSSAGHFSGGGLADIASSTNVPGAITDYSNSTLKGLVADTPGQNSGAGQMVKALAGKMVNSVVAKLIADVNSADVGGGSGSSIATYAKSFAGKAPYVWGGTTPTGWDCSGMTSYVYKHFGYNAIPRTSQAQFGWVTKTKSPTAGDLAFFIGSGDGGTASAPGHVGIVLNGTKMVSAEDPADGTAVGGLAGAVGFGTPPGGFGGGISGGAAGGSMSAAQISALWISDGGPAGAAANMARIAFAESGDNAGITQSGQPAATTGYGLYQITPTSGITQNGKFGNLLNASNNTKAAIYLYNAAGGYSPWSSDPVGASLAGGGIMGANGLLKAFANGGMITEPIAGVGKSGQKYLFGEAGNELVTPMGGAHSASASAGGDTYIINVNANNCIDPNAVAQNIHQVMRRYKNKKGGGPLGLS